MSRFFLSRQSQKAGSVAIRRSLHLHTVLETTPHGGRDRHCLDYAVGDNYKLNSAHNGRRRRSRVERSRNDRFYGDRRKTVATRRT